MPLPNRIGRRNVRGDIDPLMSYFGGGGYGSAPVPFISGNTILLYDSGGNPVEGYAATSAGLDLASAAASAGDAIWFPPIPITVYHILAAGVHYIGIYRGASQLTGQITGGDGTTLENLSIIRSEDDAGAIYGLVEGAGGITMNLINVTIDVANATGVAYAVYMANGGRIDAYDTELLAETGSAGYSVYVSSGDFYHWSGVARGTTALLPYWTD